MSDDYSAYVTDTDAPKVDLSQLQELADRQANCEAEIARMEAALNARREDLKNLSENLLPQLMDDLGLKDFTTRTGLKIKIEETIRASIPKARKLEAFAWLRSHNHAALIKRKVFVAFGKDEDTVAEELVKQLSRGGWDVEDDANVHPQTLGAFVREKLEKGEDLPLDLFGVFRQRTSKIEV